MAAPLFLTFDVRSSNGAAGTELRGLCPLRLEYLFVARICRNLFAFSHVPHKRLGYTSVVTIRSIIRFTKRPGLHDNAYATTPSYLQTEGLSDEPTARQLRKIPPPFCHALYNPHFPQPQPNPRFTLLQPSPSFSPPFQLMPASTSPECVTRVISPSPPALHVDATVARTVLRL